jgi:LysM repeat protein
LIQKFRRDCQSLLIGSGSIKFNQAQASKQEKVVPLRKMEFPTMALTKRGRNVVRGLAVASLMVVIGAGFSAVGNASESGVNSTASSMGYVKVVVAPGETLWSLATSAAANGDVTALMDQIVSVNHLNGVDLTAGQVLLVPTK